MLFTGDVILLAPSSQDIQHVLEQFTAEWEAAGIRIGASMSEALDLKWKKVVWPLQVEGEVLF